MDIYGKGRVSKDVAFFDDIFFHHSQAVVVKRLKQKKRNAMWLQVMGLVREGMEVQGSLSKIISTKD